MCCGTPSTEHLIPVACTLSARLYLALQHWPAVLELHPNFEIQRAVYGGPCEGTHACVWEYSSYVSSVV